MPGPWLLAAEDPEFVRSQEVVEDAFYEFRLRDWDDQPQGTGIFRALESGKTADYLKFRYICASDDYYAW